VAADRLEDYHQQYEQGAFVSSLRTTRLRQARRILRWIRAAVPTAGRLLDVGCGKGWFLEAAQGDGWNVAGTDTSAKAVELLASRGITGFLLRAGDRGLPADASALAPEVVTLLDVIEHFPIPDLLGRLTGVIGTAGPALQLLVIKVPTSSGLLYRVAGTLRKVGSPRILEQLYQVGTTPPHCHYFGPRSLRALLQRAGLLLVGLRYDRDFEPSSLSERAGLEKLRRLVQAAGAATAAMAWALRMEDALVCLARPGSNWSR
jgi:SAM-dependent methyltransferase